MKKTVLFKSLLLFLFASITLAAQDNLSLLSKEATLIVEGKVVTQMSFEVDGRFYTKNELDIYKVFKGGRAEPLSVLTFGGTINGISKTYSHSVMLQKSGSGIFFLVHSTMSPDLYVIKKYIPFKSDSKNELYGYGQDIVYTNIKNDLYDKLSAFLGSPKIIKLNEHESRLLENQINISGDNCVEYSIKNLGVSQIQSITGESSYSIEFDIDIRSLDGVFDLKRSELTMEYSTELFGESIVSQNNATITLGGDFSTYSFSLSDVTSNKAKVDIEKISGEIAKEINSYHRKLYHAVIGIENFDVNSILDLAVDETFDLKTFKEVGSTEVQIDCNIYDEDISIPINQLQTPHIDYLESATVTAGTKTRLKIIGSELWRSGSGWSTEVRFASADDGAGVWVIPFSGEYITQSPNVIELYVSSYMLRNDGGIACPGSGNLQVVHKKDNALEKSNEVDLVIDYALQNKYYKAESGKHFTQPLILSSPSENGSIIIKYTDAFLTAKGINGEHFRYAFERALSKWCNKTELNYIIDQNTSSPDIIVGFKPLGDQKYADTGVHSFINSDCPIDFDNTSPITNWEVDLINKPITFDFNSNKINTADAKNLFKYDLQSEIFSVEQVALHELGHAHGLEHVITDNELMAALLPNCSLDVSLNAEKASNFIQNNSLKCTESLYSKQTNCTVALQSIENNNIFDFQYIGGKLLAVTENPKLIRQFVVTSIDGKVIFVADWNNWTNHSFALRLASGFYIISAVTESQIFSKKIIITK